ncbi:MAG: O-antigen ligase family protein [Hyphomicrobium sp.]
MTAYFSAAAFAILAQVLAAVTAPWSLGFAIRVRAIAVWSIAASALFLVQDYRVVLLGTAVAMLVIAPIQPAKRAGFFLIAAPCLPVYITTLISLPGINNLLYLTHYKIAVLVLLLPMLASARPQGAPQFTITTADVCLALYVLMTAIIVAISVNPTSALRHILDQTLILVLPYSLLRYAIYDLDSVDECFKAFIYVSVGLAFVAIVSALKVWDFYQLVQPPSVFTIPDFRGGFLRINAVGTTHTLGFHLAAAIVVLEYLKTRVRIGVISLMLIRCLLLAGLFFTASRGASLGLCAALIVYGFIVVERTSMRLAFAFIIAIGSIGGGLWLLLADTGLADPYGTFSYRQSLLKTSIEQILKYPLFGDLFFSKRPEFEHLVTGQGIVDVTNLYLEVCLPFGLVGFVLFFGFITFPGLRLVGQIQWSTATKNSARVLRRGRTTPKLASGPQTELPGGSSSNGEDRRWRRAVAVTLGVITGWLTLVTTTSDAGLTMHIGLFYVALTRVLSELARPHTVTNRVGRVGRNAIVRDTKRTNEPVIVSG